MKTVSIVSSETVGCDLHLEPDGTLKIIIFGFSKDDQGNKVVNKTLVRKFTDVSSGMQDDINGLMREFSQELNEEVANEPTSTWVDL